MFLGGVGRELDIQQLYFNTCCGYTFIYPRLGDGGGSVLVLLRLRL